ncbi:cytochrome P450 [Saccharopolyspora indica]|uniref:cytochrome P450 n=1 Tax=Saccharopolyspora indica TaxID=1229659 RepID=UPI0022EB92AA|nr:cytochrome P450 [Saccharopolyspora indica]MDA3647031.1 cytochrome P450 [Saccharopolyspora indica]
MRPDEAIAALVTPAGRRNPHPHYEAIREHGNLVPVKPGLFAAVGHAECLAALREQRLLVQDETSHDISHPGWRSHSSLRGFTNSMLYRNPPDHTRMRRLVAGAFTARRMLALEPVVTALTDRLLDRMAELGADGSAVDFMAEFAFRLPVGVIGALLGVPESDQVWFREVAADVTVALEGITNLERLTAADAAMDELTAYFQEQFRHRREQPGDDLLTELVRVHDADPGTLDEAELVGNLVLLLVAGFDTTTHLLGSALATAFRHPEHAEQLRGDPDFAAGYVEETLRLDPPVQATSRWAQSDVDLLGTAIPAGTRVLLYLAAANRDPDRFPRPHRFDPHRPANKPLSFGGGIHLCLGATLARLEARVAVPRLLRRFPQLADAGGATYRDRLIVPGLERFPVVLGTGATTSAA